MADDAAVGKLQRSIEIVGILLRNDFLDMMRRLSAAEQRATGLGQTERTIPPDIPEKVRRTLEELGPTFIKIGQLLGTRPDLVPQPFVEEFRNLYDKTTPTPFPDVRAMVEEEIGAPMGKVFKEFQEKPVASASIGQVHYATLHDGERVAVKVQHPDIEQRVWTDFQIMEPIVRFVENLFAASRVWQPSDHLHELAHMLQNELDYRHEARNQQKVRENFKGNPNVKIPRIHWDHSTKRVLVLERIEGIKFNDPDDPRLQRLDGPRVAEVITHAMAQQIFADRLFHADPSPGNLMAIDSETVAFLDFGAVGKVPRRRAEHVFDLIVGFLRSDLDTVTQSLIAICDVRQDYDLRELQKDVERIMDYYERERASVGDPEILDRIINVAEQHGMLLPPDFMLITRALFQFEGLCQELDPGYELVETLEPYLAQHLRDRVLNVPGSREELLGEVLGMAENARQVPKRMNSLLRKLEANQLRFTVDVAGSSAQREDEDRAGIRQQVTWLVGALMVGTGLVVSLGGSGDVLLNFVFLTLVLLIVWAFAMIILEDV